MRLPLLLCALLLAACAGSPPPDCARGPAAAAWLVDQGWHTEIGVRAADLDGPLSTYRRVFPGAAVLMFGFGKRTWITAKVESLSELLMGPFPGPGAIQVVGLRVTPEQAFGDAEVLALSLRPQQFRLLSAFIWDAIGKTATGRPRLIGGGLFPGSLFYAASRSYAPDYTCNSWTAQALQAAGLPVHPSGIVFAGGVIDQVGKTGAACTMPGLRPNRMRKKDGRLQQGAVLHPEADSRPLHPFTMIRGLQRATALCWGLGQSPNLGRKRFSASC